MGVIKQALAEHDLAQLQLDRPAPFAPLDEQTPSWALFDACEALNVACGALSALVTPTKTRVLRHGQFMSESRSLTVAAELGVADRIVELERGAGVEAGTGVSIDDLAQAIGTTPLKLEPLIASLTHRHFFRRVAPGVYANTRHSLGLITPANDISPRAFLSHITRDFAPLGAEMTEVMLDRKVNASVSWSESPFARRNGTDAVTWLITADGGKHLERLTEGVPWLVSNTIEGIRRDFDWAALGPTVVIDCASMDGERMLKIAPEYPNLRKVVLQDIDSKALEDTKQVYDAKLPDAFPSQRFTLSLHDCRDPQPQPVLDLINESPDDTVLFFARAFVCDLNDDDAVQFFKAIAPVFRERAHRGKNKTRLIVHDLFPTALETSWPTPLVPGASPHLGQYGTHPPPGMPLTCATMERMVSTMLGGVQRPVDALENLLNRAGLTIVRMHRHRTLTGTAE